MMLTRLDVAGWLQEAAEILSSVRFKRYRNDVINR